MWFKAASKSNSPAKPCIVRTALKRELLLSQLQCYALTRLPYSSHAHVHVLTQHGLWKICSETVLNGVHSNAAAACSQQNGLTDFCLCFRSRVMSLIFAFFCCAFSFVRSACTALLNFLFSRCFCLQWLTQRLSKGCWQHGSLFANCSTHHTASCELCTFVPRPPCSPAHA